MIHKLLWPQENSRKNDHDPVIWSHQGSNLCLDFHGNPVTAGLVVFSDGNHHMALMETLQRFGDAHPEASDIFYVTTPPGPLVQWLHQGSIQIGNLQLSLQPHIFFSPPAVLDKLRDEKYLCGHSPFMRNRGNVLLVRKGNPHNICSVADLAQENVRLFLSNPKTEAVSYQGYVDTLKMLAQKARVPLDFLDDKKSERIVYGECIHHREAPQAIADDHADVAIVYYHLALRYCRIFPETFEIVALGGSADDPQPDPENSIAFTSVGVVGSGGPWGQTLVDFLMTDTVTKIYAYHGLLRP